jgi:hypothetical protein
MPDALATLKAELAAARTRWSDHVKICYACKQAGVRKRPGMRCDRGQEYAAEIPRLARLADQEQQRAARQLPGQSEMF